MGPIATRTTLWFALTSWLAIASACSRIRTQVGTVAGAPYRIDMPSRWNGTLLLYSHGGTLPGQPNIAPTIAPDEATGHWLLQHGYALAGSAYRSTGFIVDDGLRDGLALLDLFEARFGRPKQTIAWGASLGGMISTGLVQREPTRFHAAMPLCGALAGSVALLNPGLDETFAFKTLLAPTSDLALVHIADGAANGEKARRLFDAAVATPEGFPKSVPDRAVGRSSFRPDAASVSPKRSRPLSGGGSLLPKPWAPTSYRRS
jgi:hypothetical protein